MSKRRTRTRRKQVRGSKPATGLRSVRVTARNYGNKLKGIRIYYEGAKPSGLRPDGSVNLGKNILEILTQRFGPKFRWIISDDTSSIDLRGHPKPANEGHLKTGQRE